MKLKRTTVEVISLLLILLFVYTATSKWIDPPRFTAQLNKQPFGEEFTPWLFWLIPGSEVLLVILLVIPKTRTLGLFGSALLMLIFTVYVGLVTANVFEHVPCTCGGIISQLGWPQHLVMNSIFLALAIWAFIWNRKLPVEQAPTKLASA
ncbi:methylamine utilization protein MauE [Chitinophaga skermanii]|uniref:Methylamine utilization protein MauE n=1 Tax=Chitinophaga skermanii TaxID=331697 RepID=A0A327QPD8_9BACT|nr:MauE/DoxX family redox-associated membrane protein [Chitinophaga skermanii]RAJ06496.1 methylamine utilization protein MauE [Chitinophaga skermanii]